MPTAAAKKWRCSMYLPSSCVISSLIERARPLRRRGAMARVRALLLRVSVRSYAHAYIAHPAASKIEPAIYNFPWRPKTRDARTPARRLSCPILPSFGCLMSARPACLRGGPSAKSALIAMKPVAAAGGGGVVGSAGGKLINGAPACGE